MIKIAPVQRKTESSAFVNFILDEKRTVGFGLVLKRGRRRIDFHRCLLGFGGAVCIGVVFFSASKGFGMNLWGC